MKTFIRQRLREQIIDGQEMNLAMETMCDKMTVDSYEEVLHYVEESLKGVDDKTRYEIMQKIHAPLENLKHEQNKIKDEVSTKHMSGDSIPDEANTYWHQIQSTICELGSNFQ
jgi:hypothetical protein